MSRVQVVLVLLVAGSSLLYFTTLRTRLWDRLLVIVLALTGTYLILQPNEATFLAHLLGVGRGADLIFYLAIISLGFIVLLLFSKIRELESRLIKISRATATIQTPSPLYASDASDRGKRGESAPGGKDVQDAA